MKKKIVSMLLALTLVVTGIPSGMTTGIVYAAEVLEDGIVRPDETEEAASVMESNDASLKTLHSEESGLYAFNVAENGKAVGSDGVAYDDVAYLSADMVRSFGAEGQSNYVEICDRIAEEKNAGDYLEDVVIAVDEEGNLLVQREVSMNLLQTLMEELAEDAFETSTVISEDLSIKEDTEEIAVDDNSGEEGLHNEDSSDENTADETDTEEVVEEDSKAEASVEDNPVEKEELLTEEVMTEEVMTEEVMTEEVMTDNALMEDASVEEPVAEEYLEEKTEAATEEPVLTAENMELIYEPEVEEFEIVENAKADVVIDLGYGSTGDVQQFNSILPADDWFSKQLTERQKSIYNACKVMGKGTNTFTISPSSMPSTIDIYQAISAYIMTEPYKCDWMDTTKNTKIIDYYVVDTKKYVKTTVELGKSKYYTSAIQKEANAKVLELAAAAQAYALENYPNAPVYGIVKYFDKWICENNYYNMLGVYGGSSEDKKTQEIYYYCHSSYGILLKGYGVCESYALAMTRLLDAVGIPNMYATGQVPGGGHAWNYIQMPDGKWYLQDSTWNDSEAIGTSTKDYLLCRDDSEHIPMGNRYTKYDKAFQFVSRAAINYSPANESITLSKTEINLLLKKTEQLTCDSTYIANENIPKVWSSSDEKVAKVDKNGKVTAVGAGSAEITLTAAGMSDTCTVNVHQINSITFENGGKASLTASCGIESGSGSKETQHILLTVNQKAENPAYTAEELNQKGVFDDFEVKSSNESVAKVSHTLTGNTIDLAIKPVSMGKTTITVTFGTKKATLNFAVSEKLNESWFELGEVKELQDNTKLMYTGKAYKPKVTLTPAGKDKKVKFKVSYLNNKDAGTASVVITGTGTYGGELKYDFTIKPLELKVDPSSIKVSEKSVYNGGVNLTKSTVKHIDESGKSPKKVSLKAGKDYDIEYTKKNSNEDPTTQPTEVGEYKMAIVGKGNYAGGANTHVTIKDTTWTIEQCDIKKVKVAVKVNGTTPTVTVAIGKNELPKKDYKMTFYADKECTKAVSSFASKTQYFVKVEPAAGSNITIGAKSKPIVKSFKTK